MEFIRQIQEEDTAWLWDQNDPILNDPKYVAFGNIESMIIERKEGCILQVKMTAMMFALEMDSVLIFLSRKCSKPTTQRTNSRRVC